MRLPALVASVLLSALIAAVVLPMRNSSAQNDDADTKRQLRHVVLFKFNDDASEADVRKIVDAFRALPDKIPEIADFEYGTNNSPEGLSDGFTHCFLVTFRSEADRATYLPHPEHEKFVELLRPHLDKALVVDYWAET